MLDMRWKCNCRRRKGTGGLEQGSIWVAGACLRSRSMLDVSSSRASAPAIRESGSCHGGPRGPLEVGEIAN